ncbi:MAG: 30S ribosomal protein S24e [Methanomassiliicoccales archaeon]|jgi:small subunit ribosomal protein S24e|nr:30S ribosomal protein S24e [Methanomassiliicoccales archaeon]
MELKIEIESKKENVLQERMEMYFRVDHQGEPTPSRDAIKSKLAELLNVQKERVVIASARTEFGKSETRGYAKVYDSVDAAKKHESKYVLVRNKLIQREEKKKAEAAKPAAAAKK